MRERTGDKEGKSRTDGSGPPGTADAVPHIAAIPYDAPEGPPKQGGLLPLAQALPTAESVGPDASDVHGELGLGPDSLTPGGRGPPGPDSLTPGGRGPPGPDSLIPGGREPPGPGSLTPGGRRPPGPGARVPKAPGTASSPVLDRSLLDHLEEAVIEFNSDWAVNHLNSQAAQMFAGPGRGDPPSNLDAICSDGVCAGRGGCLDEIKEWCQNYIEAGSGGCDGYPREPMKDASIEDYRGGGGGDVNGDVNGEMYVDGGSPSGPGGAGGESEGGGAPEDLEDPASMTVIPHCERRDATGNITRHRLKVVAVDGGDDGGGPSFALFVSDLSREKDMENKLRRSYEKLWDLYERDSELNRLKSEIVTIISHELRTPMTIIKGYVDLLKQGSESLTPRQAKSVDAIRLNTQRIIILINDMLRLAQMESEDFSLDPQPEDLGGLVQDAVGQIMPLVVEKEHSITVDAPADRATVRVDGVWFRQAVTNLLSNAVKYTPRGGNIHVAMALGNRQVTLSVSDDGEGISKDELGKIFYRFYTAGTSLARESSRTGLGLSIAKRIVELHDGEIIVESQKGKGSTFSIKLPMFFDEN